ncbi:hypothetical protein B0H13DRAFT_1115143 [Mycena leptocephala]|nr:hypothetical protein B0H13DRAFT_1115143 [Mycena leptocephala]
MPRCAALPARGTSSGCTSREPAHTTSPSSARQHAPRHASPFPNVRISLPRSLPPQCTAPTTRTTGTTLAEQQPRERLGSGNRVCFRLLSLFSFLLPRFVYVSLKPLGLRAGRVHRKVHRCLSLRLSCSLSRPRFRPARSTLSRASVFSPSSTSIFLLFFPCPERLADADHLTPRRHHHPYRRPRTRRSPPSHLRCRAALSPINLTLACTCGVRSTATVSTRSACANDGGVPADPDRLEIGTPRTPAQTACRTPLPAAISSLAMVDAA